MRIAVVGAGSVGATLGRAWIERGEDVIWGAKFKSMFNLQEEDGELSIDIRKLHDFEDVPVR